MGIRRNFRPTNLVTNGNFAQGTIGWTPMYGTGAIVNSKYEFTLTTKFPAARIDTPTLNTLTNHVYYVAATLLLPRASTVTYHIGNKSVTVKNLTANVKERASVNIIATETKSPLRLYCSSNDALEIGDKVYYEAIQAIDLTAIFGPGNEPTKEWCDLNIHNWFDGTLSGGKRIGGVR